MSAPANSQNPPVAVSQNATAAPVSSQPGSSANVAAGSVQPTARSYASATKKTSSPPIVSSGTPPVAVGAPQAAQHGKSSSVSPVNGKNPIQPAVPAMAPAIVNSSGIASADHSRKSSVTISAPAPGGHMPNGAQSGSSRASGLKFGALGGDSPSPAASHAVPHQPQGPSLTPQTQNPRVASPAHSPQPIPQFSGGKPNSNNLTPNISFHAGEGAEQNNRPTMPQQQHTRRESSQSAHGAEAPTFNPTRTFQPNGGRGRGGFQPHYNPQQHASPQMQYRPMAHTQQRGGPAMAPPFQPQGAPMHPNSPYRGAPRSPAMTPAAMQQQQHLVNGQMPYYNPAAYPQQPYQVPADMLYGNYYQPHMGLQQSIHAYPPPMMAPNSPNRMPVYPHMPGGQFVPGAPHYPPPQAMSMSMSRTPSQVSERPPSVAPATPSMPSVSHVSHTPNPSVGNSPAPSSFTVPQKKKSAIVIKNPDGEIVTFDNKKPASPAPPPQPRSPAIVSTPGAPTPPPRVPSAADSSHSRTESSADQSVDQAAAELRRAQFVAQFKAQTAGVVPEKTKQEQDESDKKAAEEKKAADEKKAEEDAKAKAAKEQAEKEEAEKAAAEKAAAEKADAEKAAAEKKAADEKKAEEEAKEKAAKDEADKKASDEKEAADAKKVEDDKAEKARLEEEEMERMIAEMEAKEKEDEEREKAYAEKKAKENEIKKAKEAELKAKEDERLRALEREAEELEEKRAKEGSGADSESKKLFASLGKSHGLGPQAQAAASEEAAAPEAEAEAAQPKVASKPRPAHLKVDTTKSVEPAQPSAALQSLQSARFLDVQREIQYPDGFRSPNPAANMGAKKGRQYDKEFLLQFQDVFKDKPREDWDQKLKETVGDTSDTSARPQSARTMSSRQPSRGGMPAGGAMGNFGQFGGGAPPGRTLPPGTTSEQRFQQASQGGRTMVNPLANMVPSQRGAGAFPMGRQSSFQAAGGPSSPRVGSGRGRGSRRGEKGPSRRDEENAAKAMPLTANLDPAALKLERSQSGWKPHSQVSAANAVLPSGHMPPDMVQRKVKSALNKMTPEKFDKIADQILEIAAQSKDENDGRTLRQVIQLTFEKACDEAHWASMYAKFAQRMLNTMSPEIKDENVKDKHGNPVVGGALFRKYLLNRCQEEFERGWEINLPENTDGKSGIDNTNFSEEYYIAAAAKRKGLGLIQFIGELYKLKMLTLRIMHECVLKLLDFEGMPDESAIESLTKLIRTVGSTMQHEDAGPKMLQVYFDRIEKIMNYEGLPSRLKFMLLDIVDLRKANWHSKDANKGPKTIQEIHAEAAALEAQKEQERARSGRGGGGGPRPQIGRGDARSFSGGGMMPPQDYPSSRVQMDDLRKLSKGASNRNSSTAGQLGPSMLGSRSSSRRGLGPGGFMGRGDESGASSRTGTPPQKEKESTTHVNSFSALAALENHDTPEVGSPPSSASSPPVQRAAPASEVKDDKPSE